MAVNAASCRVEKRLEAVSTMGAKLGFAISEDAPDAKTLDWYNKTRIECTGMGRRGIQGGGASPYNHRRRGILPRE
jgi:hypothetical protein